MCRSAANLPCTRTCTAIPKPPAAEHHAPPEAPRRCRTERASLPARPPCGQSLARMLGARGRTTLHVVSHMRARRARGRRQSHIAAAEHSCRRCHAARSASPQHARPRPDTPVGRRRPGVCSKIRISAWLHTAAMRTRWTLASVFASQSRVPRDHRMVRSSKQMQVNVTPGFQITNPYVVHPFRTRGNGSAAGSMHMST